MWRILRSATGARSAAACRTRTRRPNCRCWPCFTAPSSRPRGRTAAVKSPPRNFSYPRLTNCLEPEEIVFEIDFPIPKAHTGWAFEEVARRFGDFALACIAVSFELRDGRIADARVAVMGVADTPRRLREAEDALRGAQARTGNCGAICRGCTFLRVALGRHPCFRRIPQKPDRRAGRKGIHDRLGPRGRERSREEGHRRHRERTAIRGARRAAPACFPTFCATRSD